MVVVVPVGIAVAAMLSTAAVMFAPKIPVYEFAMIYPPLVWFGDTWGELKATLHAELRVQNENVIQSDVHAASFDLYFPTWDGDMVQFGHVEDRFQDQPDYSTPKEGFWKLKPKELFQQKDSVILRLRLSNLRQILTHLLYRAFQGSGTVSVMITGITHITTPKNMKSTLTFICDTNLNVITNKMLGSSCSIDKLSPGVWGNMTKVTESLQAIAVTLHPDPVNGTVHVNGKPQKKLTL